MWWEDEGMEIYIKVSVTEIVSNFHLYQIRINYFHHYHENEIGGRSRFVSSMSLILFLDSLNAQKNSNVI